MVLKRLASLALPAIALAGLWALLTDGAADGWIVGIPAIAMALWAGARLGTGAALAPVVWPRLLGFAPYFLWASVRGGADVALRALRPRLDVAPGFVSYRPRLESRQALGVFLGVVSLLPGTLSVRLEGPHARIHVLDARVDHRPELQRLEARVARLFRGEGLGA